VRPRTEALLALLVLGGVAAIGALAGRSEGGAPDFETRPSTFLAEPEGSRALLEAAQRLGLQVRRFRERPVQLGRVADSLPKILVILDPTAEFSAPEVAEVLRLSRGSDLLLAGPGAAPLMRCFGYRVERLPDSVAVAPPGREPGREDPVVGRVLLRTGETVAVDSSRSEDIGRFACQVPAVAHREVLLQTGEGGMAGIGLTLDDGRQVLLFSDAAPFRNRNLRRTTAGPFVLGLLTRSYREVVFEEYHHGFGPSGSLAGAALGWSRRSPWGWAMWQLALVGLLALLFGAIRFGPTVQAIPRIRRSPLEHVHALATALSAARGHEEAIGAMVRGLRRRLALPGMRPVGDWRAWLEQLDRGSEPLTRLKQLARPGQTARSVRLAAHAVEDLWQELKS